MANPRIEIYRYRHALTRMRLGDTDRAVARAGLLGRARAAAVRRVAAEQGWLGPAAPPPTDAEIARHIKRPAARSSSVSLVEPFAAEVEAWSKEGIQGTTIYQALVRKHGFTGSYASVRRFLSGLEHRQPQATVVLDFAPGEVAQVDFGRAR